MKSARWHRRDVEGLRAVAVTLVVAAHLAGWPAGGFVGVDVFFVLSGFLITTLLAREHAMTGRISLPAFYLRRARRLLPAAVVVVVATCAAARLLAPARAAQALTDAAWSAAFAANVHFAAIGTDYFDATRPPSPLQHLWSLAVEEQFYLVWPLLLVGLLGLRRHVPARARPWLLLAPVLALCAASLAWSVVRTGSAPAAAYFDTACRGFELAAGAALALHGTRRPWPSYAGAVVQGAGLAGIAGCALLLSPATHYPGAVALAPTLATVLAVAGGGQRRTAGLLACSPLGYLGRLSYVLYLWHWPVLVVGAGLLGTVGVPSPAWAAAALGLSLALSVATHHLIEQPVRERVRIRRRPVAPRRLPVRAWPGRPARSLLAGAAAAALVTVLGAGPPTALAGPAGPRAHGGYVSSALVYDAPTLAAAVQQAVRADRFPDLRPSLADLPAAGAPEWVADGCADTDGRNVATCRYGSGSRGVVAVLGDSLADSWVPGLRAALEPAGWQVQLLTRTRCPATYLARAHDGDAGRSQCADHQAFAVEQVRALHPAAVVLTDSPLHLSWLSPAGTSLDGQWAEWRVGMARTVRELAPLTGHVLVVGAPPGSGNLQSCAGVFAAPARCTSRLSQAWYRLRAAEAGGVADAQVGAGYVDVEPWFCTSGRCPAFLGSTPVYFDGRHLTAQFSRELAGLLAGRLALGVPARPR